MNKQAAQHRAHWTSAGFAHTFGDSAPTADSASGGFSRQIPPAAKTHRWATNPDTQKAS